MTQPAETSRRRALATALVLSVGAASGVARGEPSEKRLVTRKIPKSGESIPVVGLGSWRVFDIAGDRAALAQGREALRVFAELGGRLVDSSPMYGSSESVLGELILALGLRSRLFLATKVWTSGREAGVRQMEDSLGKLGSARIELMQVHNLLDARTHLETLRAWKKSGRIRYLGVTHYHAGAHDELERFLGEIAVDFVQVNYSLAEPEAERRLLGVAEDKGVAVLVNRPFAEGALFQRVKGKSLPPWAGEIGCASFAQLFLKWILAHPAVTCAIAGTRNPKHVADNLGAARGSLPDAASRRRIAEYFRSL